jgi:hypothetical protein
MIVQRAELAKEALDKSLELREEAGLAFGTPLNVYDLCERLTPKVRVRFADYSMEGCYCRSDRPLIEVSALRRQHAYSFGGTFVWACDSRFPSKYPVPLHDRVL